MVLDIVKKGIVSLKLNSSPPEKREEKQSC
jgi:hypothetical protein